MLPLFGASSRHTYGAFPSYTIPQYHPGKNEEYPIENGSTSRTFIEKCAVFSGRTVEK